MEGFFNQTVKPYDQYIPLGFAFSFFVTMLSVASLWTWIPTLILNAIIRGLTALNIVQIVTETREVRRTILE
jgi:hypothetical protein